MFIFITIVYKNKLMILNTLRIFNFLKIFKQSFNEGMLSNIFKHSYMTPLYKGVSKMIPTNYIAFSLTLYFMKVFNRVIKSYIIKHIESHNQIIPKQHGFVSGQCTQTHLMHHYCDVFDALQEGIRINTVYLDFAKTFELISWIRNFLCNRKYCVVANGLISEEQNVLSGVPQRTVLALLFF